MNKTPIYIESLKLSGIKTFAGPTELKMTGPNGEIAQWTLILGENGIGKSSLLQCIAWMKPALPYDVTDLDDLKPAPLINDEENEILERLVSRYSENQLQGKIEGNFVANSLLGNCKNIELVATCKTSMTIGVNESRKLSLVEPSVSDEGRDVFYKDEVVVYGYSASRTLGDKNLADSKLLDTIPGFINEKSELYDAEEILHGLNYAKLGTSERKEKHKYSKIINDILNMLVDVLPDVDSFSSIEIIPPKILFSDPEGGIIITTKYGKKIPFGDFSLGYKTAASLTIDLAWRLFNKYQGDSTNPLHEPAIVLIDEVDLHLHPMWQQNIMKSLSKHFPNVQFIATAHSPLMVQSALDYSYAVVTTDVDSGHLTINNRPEELDGWRVDQILTSELFGLESARGVKYDALLVRRQELMQKKRKVKSVKDELQEIDTLLKQMPTGENPEDIESRELISVLYNKLINGDIKLDND